MPHWSPALRVLATCLLLAAAAACAATAARADTYVLDRSHTNITFSWDRLGITRQLGRVLDFEGTLELDVEKPEDARLEVTMQAASLSTGVAELDKHLRSSDFFDARRHPLITFKSTAVKRTGEKSAEVWGDLTIMGVAKPVILAVSLTFAGEHPLGRLNANFAGRHVAGFVATARIQRSDWGLSRGTPIASDEVDITINAELLRQ